MTRKDFELIAKALNNEGLICIHSHDRDVVGMAANALAKAIKAQHPRFNHYKFMDAVTEGW